MTKTIDLDVRDVILQSTFIGNKVILPPDILPRDLYTKVDKVFKAAGGKWNRSEKAHFFTDNAEETILNWVENGKFTDAKSELGQFDTPVELAKYLVEFAEISPDMEALEPSAGIGRIAVELERACATVTAIEIHKPRFDLLKKNASLLIRVINEDFLQYQPNTEFDRVVMNPPFAKQAELEHVTRAFEMLKPGGILVSVMSNSINFRSDKKTKAFLEMIGDHNYEIRNLPEGSFKESGTNVNTIILKIVKNRA